MNKKKNVSIALMVFGGLIFVLLLVVMGPGLRAGETDTIGVTVTAKNISLYVKDATVAYLTISIGGRKCSTTTSDTQLVINNGSATEDFNVKGTDTTNWDIGTSSPGTEIYTHLFSTTTETTSIWKYVDNEYVYLETGLAVDATSTVDFYISVPSSTTNYGAQSTNITVQAVE